MSRYDEEAAYARPGRSSRRRSKERPRHTDAVAAWVVTVDRGRYTCRLDTADNDAIGNDDASDTPTVVTAVKARDLGRRGVVVGDRVRLTGDVSGTEGTLARIVSVSERSTLLRRSADDTDPVERPLVANADQLVVVMSVADPAPNTRFVDRCLVAAYDGGLDPLLCLTKTDLADPGSVLAGYRPLGVSAVTCRRDADPEEVRERLAGRRSVLIGPSGVGKSTLVNRLVPDADRSTGHVNEVTGRGRHTSTSAVVLELPGGGWIIDTPGIRSFGLAHVQPATIVDAFEDLAAITRDCPRGCPHTAEAPECALTAAVEAGTVDPARVDSLRRLLADR